MMIVGPRSGASIARDPSFSSVSALLHCEDGNGATTFTDRSSLADNWVGGGNAAISTLQSKFGTGSILFDGTNSFAQPTANAGFAFGTGAFTIELFARPTSVSAFQGVYASVKQAGIAPLTWRITNTGTLQFTADSFIHSITTAAAITVSAWQHIAVSYDGTTYRQFIGGALDASTMITGGSIAGTQPVIGVEQNADWFVGNMDEIRVTKGVCRYTSNFTPAIAPFPNF